MVCKPHENRKTRPRICMVLRYENSSLKRFNIQLGKWLTRATLGVVTGRQVKIGETSQGGASIQEFQVNGMAKNFHPWNKLVAL